MASEITLNATLQYSDSDGTIDAIQVADKLVTVATKIIARHKQSVGFTVAVALNLGPVVSLGFIMVKNLDATNFVNVLTGTAGVIFAKIKPGECLLFRAGSGVIAPFIQADTAAVVVEVLICSL